MTEQQIENLQKLLSRSTLEGGSKELDERILQASRERVPTPVRESWFSIYSAMTAGALAVILTIGLFFAMGHIVNVEEPVFVAQPDESNTTVKAQIVDQKSSNSVNHQVDRPKKIQIVPRPEPQPADRNKILFEYTLPTTDSLLASMVFNPGFDHEQVAGRISVALNDIQGMINRHQFESARQRYAQLVRVCRGCKLPKTLDELALADTLITKPG